MTDNLSNHSPILANRLSDNEIIKALEDKIEFENFDENGYAVVGIEKLKNALSLITRQKAEIERLKKANETFTDIGKMYSEIKAEAYKEFAERLNAKFAVAIIKNISVEFALGYKTAFIDITDNIDNLLKKMVGDDK